jgi:asparagine synthase (glutamine-hydrolysing)
VVTPSIEEMLSTLIEHYDEPFGDSSAIPTLYLCRMTRQHVTVALSGDGADELFGGYDRYRLGVLENRLRRLFPGWFRHTALAALGHAWPRTDFLPRPLRFKSMLTCVSQEIADGYFTSVTAFRDGSLDAVLSPYLRRELSGYTAREGFRKHFEGLEHLPALDQMQAADIKTYLPGDILVKIDRASMAYSLEARAPWLDYRLAELAATLPQSFKVSGANGKVAFKHALARYLPVQTASRRKQGFIVPMTRWMRTSLRSVFERIVFRPEMEELLDPAETRRLWNQHQGGLLDNSTRLWYVLMLACWHAHHGPGAGRALVAESLAR